MICSWSQLNSAWFCCARAISKNIFIPKKNIEEETLVKKEKKEEKTEEGTNGLGQVQYFTYPNTEDSMGAVEMNELDKINNTMVCIRNFFVAQIYQSNLPFA